MGRNDARERRRLWRLGWLLLVCAILYTLNLHTPLQMDDYDYSFSWATGKRLHSLADVFASQVAHYRLWGGRSVTHFLTQLFLLLGKPIFNVANAALYGLLLLEIGVLSGRRSGIALAVSHLALFFGIPFFGTVFLWLDGACNYLWGTALALLPLLISARNEQRPMPFSPAALGLILLCFFAGWTNENTALGILGGRAAWLIARRRRGEPLMRWEWVSLAAQGLGVALLLLAPGNAARAGIAQISLGERIRSALITLLYGAGYASGPLALMVALHRAEEVGTLSLRERALILSALLSAAAMAASPEFSERTLLGTCVLLLAAVLSVCGKALQEGMPPRRMCGLATLLLVLTLFGAQGAYREVRAHEQRWHAQRAAIQRALQAGDSEVRIEGVQSVSRYTQDIWIAQQADQWPNSTLSAFYKIHILGKRRE